MSRHDFFSAEKLLAQRLSRGVRELKESRFYQQWREKIEANLPLTEKFARQFADKFFRHYADMGQSPLAVAFKLSRKDELEFLSIIADAWTLARVGKLQPRVETQPVAGDETVRRAQSFRTDVMALTVSGKVGQSVADVRAKYHAILEERAISRDYEHMDPNKALSLIIGPNGRIYLPPPPENEDLPLYGNVAIKTGGEPETGPLEEGVYFEGDEEIDGHYVFELAVVWDLENAVPVSLGVYGDQGSEGGHQYSLEFFFQHEDTGVNQFPPQPAQTDDFKVSFAPDGTNVTTQSTVRGEFESQITIRKYQRLGEMAAPDGRKLSIWATNTSQDISTTR